MNYQSFNIKSFRGISEVSIDLSHGRILSLVGLNESGKSTILTAIDLFYKVIKGKNLTQTELNSFRPKGIDFTGDIQISGKIAFDREDITKLIAFWTTKNMSYSLDFPRTFSYTIRFTYKLHKYESTTLIDTLDIKSTTDRSNLFDLDKPKWDELVVYIKSNLIPEILFYEDFIFEIPERITFPKSGTPTVDPKNMEWQKVLNDILISVHPDLTSFQEHIVNIWDSDNDTASNRIAQMEKVLNDKITSGWKALFKQKGKKSSSQRLNFKEIILSCVPDATNLFVSFKVRTGTNKEFLINERSKGCKWFFSFLIFTEFRKKRSRNILFLLDEPASNLHSSAQLKILEAISDLGDESMIIYSTHSHHLINPKWLAGAYVVINDVISDARLEGDMTSDDGAKITAEKYFTYVGKGRGNVKMSYFQPILDRLDYTPSTIEPIPNIVITEGKYDWYAFNYFLEIILKKSGEIRFYPGAGRDQLWEIIRLYLSWGKKFLVILDGDLPGVKSKQSYINEFNDFIKDKIFTLKDILGTALETEDLIESKDKKNLCDSAFGRGVYASIQDDPDRLKSTLNFAINQLLVKGEEVEVSDKTKNTFQLIFKFLQNHR